jgi:serine/threonine protein phosphatase PrpC
MATFIPVQWEVHCDQTSLGDQVVVLGSDEALGCWQPSSGLPMTTSGTDFPIWRTSCSLAGGREIEWKVAILHADGSCRWEDIENRRSVLPSKSDSTGSLSLRLAFNDSRVDHEIRRLSEECRRDEATSTKAKEQEEEPAVPHPPRVIAETTVQGGLKNLRQQFIAIDLAGMKIEEHSERMPKVEAVFEADNSHYDLCYDKERSVYTFFPRTAGIRPGLYSFHFLVDGERALSNMHAAVSESNKILFHEPLLKYAWQCRAQMQNPTAVNLQTKLIESGSRLLRRNETRHFDPFDDTDVDVENTCLKPMDRESSAISMASTVSTCDSFSEFCSSDEDLQARALSDSTKDADASAVCSREMDVTTEATFSKQVFEQLYTAELRCWLDGQLPPEDLSSTCRPMQLLSGASRLPKPGGRCEDAFFIGKQALGVADGVGAMANYARFGVDAAAYSAELMDLSSKALVTGGSAWHISKDTKPRISAYAAEALALAENGTKSYGASTATVLALKGNTVGVANLGDSGFMLLRKAPRGMAIIERSREQQHSWNLPYQLMRVPPRLISRLPKNVKLDTAADCEQYEVIVRNGDLLILFTDGLSDNLHEEEILQIVNRTLSPAFGELLGSPGLATPAEDVAKALALAARERSRDPVAKVPFAENSQLQGHSECQGGKVDDITVVAAWVVPEAS